jgi:hypothetical protein
MKYPAAKKLRAMRSLLENQHGRIVKVYDEMTELRTRPWKGGEQAMRDATICAVANLMLARNAVSNAIRDVDALIVQAERRDERMGK